MTYWMFRLFLKSLHFLSNAMSDIRLKKNHKNENFYFGVFFGNFLFVFSLSFDVCPYFAFRWQITEEWMFRMFLNIFHFLSYSRNYITKEELYFEINKEKTILFSPIFGQYFFKRIFSTKDRWFKMEGLVSLRITGRDDISMQLLLGIFGHAGFIHGWLSSCPRRNAKWKKNIFIYF